MIDPIALSESIITKLCHDLAGPIGAIQNGLEFLSEDISEEMNEKSMNIISFNSQELCIKLKFLRSIYGKSQNDGEVEISEAQAIAKDFLALKKISIEIENEKHGTDYVQLTYKASKLLLLLIFIAAESLITGGKINLTLGRKDQTKFIKITATGEKVKDLEEFHSIISGKQTAQVKTNTAHYFFATQIAKATKADLSYSMTDDCLNILCEFK